MLLFIQSIVCLTFAYTYTDNHRAYVIAKQTFKPQCLYNRHSTPTDYDNRDCVLHPQNSARNPLIVRAESSKCPRGIRRLSARIYADFLRGRLRKKLSFPCHVPYV